MIFDYSDGDFIMHVNERMETFPALFDLKMRMTLEEIKTVSHN